MTEITLELWRTDIKTRFSDMDAQGHINNLAYLEYIQECRVQWFRSLALGGEYGTVVVNSNIEYLRELVYPVTVTVIMKGSGPGRSSLLTYYEILANAEEVYMAARGHAKIVFVDPGEGKSVSIPEHVRQQLG